MGSAVCAPSCKHTFRSRLRHLSPHLVASAAPRGCCITHCLVPGESSPSEPHQSNTRHVLFFPNWALSHRERVNFVSVARSS
jgi:hypothetical protein